MTTMMVILFLSLARCTLFLLIDGDEKRVDGRVDDDCLVEYLSPHRWDRDWVLPLH